MRFKRSIISLLILLLTVQFTGVAFTEGPVTPTEKDKCPVCGMAVSPYQKWIAEILFKDGSYVVFDGPKDMLKYYFNISKYSKQRRTGDISEIYVTEYYTTRMMKAEDLYFIVGSDVKGPMGKEIVPVKGEAEAKTFMKDHNGKKILRFIEITPADIPGGKMQGM